MVALLAGLAVILLGVGYPLQQSYLDHRYTATLPLPKIYSWARDQQHQRIAVFGTQMQYPLYGNDLSNYVQYVGAHGPHGQFGLIPTCQQWRAALNAGHYDYVVIAPSGFFPECHATGGAVDEGRPECAARDHGFRIDARRADPAAGPLDPNGCAALEARGQTP